MNRLAFLGVVACLWVCVLTGTGRAGSITYDLYQGGSNGTLLAEFTTPDFVVLDMLFEPPAGPITSGEWGARGFSSRLRAACGADYVNRGHPHRRSH
jgi:hypothetical protein